MKKIIIKLFEKLNIKYEDLHQEFIVRNKDGSCRFWISILCNIKDKYVVESDFFDKPRMMTIDDIESMFKQLKENK